jgi:hypothetical protein
LLHLWKWLKELELEKQLDGQAVQLYFDPGLQDKSSMRIQAKFGQDKTYRHMRVLASPCVSSQVNSPSEKTTPEQPQNFSEKFLRSFIAT